MGSRYGLLLASGARRYCRAAIRVALVLSHSPSFFAVIRSFLLVFLVPHQREWWCMGPREEEGLVGWESFRRTRRHTRALYADNIRQNAFSGKDFFLCFFSSTFHNFSFDIDIKKKKHFLKSIFRLHETNLMKDNIDDIVSNFINRMYMIFKKKNCYPYSV